MWCRKRKAEPLECPKESPEQPTDYKSEWVAADRAAQAMAMKLIPGAVYYLPMLGVAEEYMHTETLRIPTEILCAGHRVEVGARRSPPDYRLRLHWFVGGAYTTAELAGIEPLFPEARAQHTWTPNPVAIDPR